MSNSAVGTEAVAESRINQKGRTRLEPIGGSGKSQRVMLLLLGLSLFGALVSRFYGGGASVHLTSNSPGAIVRLDGGRMSGTADASGNADLLQVPYGSRSVEIIHPDYERFETAVSVSLLSANRFPFQLKPIPLTLTVNTIPGAEVSLNGQSQGNANSQGVFSKDGVNSGIYDILVTLPGYSSFSRARYHLSPASNSLDASLTISPERQRQMQEELQRELQGAERSRQLVIAARQQFNARQYEAALQSVDEALKIQPGNVEAQQLRSQVVQTMNILK